MGYFLKGVEFRNPRLTRNPHIWIQYFCWCIYMLMWTHKPYYPMFIRGLVLKHWPNAHQRWSMNWRMVEQWRSVNPNYKLTDAWRPLPWYIGEAALGPLHKPWMKLANQFNKHTGGRSHRCEFTDRQRGALYGGADGGFMDAYFEQFIANISDD